ncbi:phosphatase [Acetobacter pomorum]|uniref:Phosphatase n=1 Tax=Acetobacter pomorum TaxID=65959 RepID=A0A2G4REM7_9PROT|nr:HAD family phosphatase [Acetobacter pomorum]PHY95022.1 phosphatase [Acetobacter pomorum]
MMAEHPLVLSPQGHLKLIIFDCDGVLVDSEETCCRISAEEARRAGMDVPDEQAVKVFSGMALPGIQNMIEQKTGVHLGHDWAAMMQKRFVAAMKNGVEPVEGVYDMLNSIRKLGVPVRVASNSSQEEMDAKFSITNLETFFEKRIHSARDMGIPKPNPAVYLKAAEEEGVSPSECLVLEDSDTGARAAVDAGMTCVMLRAADKTVPEWENILKIHTLSEFAPLVEKALQQQGH